MQTNICLQCKKIKRASNLAGFSCCNCKQDAIPKPTFEQDWFGYKNNESKTGFSVKNQQTNKQDVSFNKQHSLTKKEAELLEIFLRINKVEAIIPCSQKSNYLTRRRTVIEESIRSFTKEMEILPLDNHEVIQANRNNGAEIDNFNRKNEGLTMERDIMKPNEAKFDSMLGVLVTEKKFLRNPLTELQNQINVLQNEKNRLELQIKLEKNNSEKSSAELENENNKLNIEIRKLLQDKHIVDKELQSCQQLIKHLIREKDFLQADKGKCTDELHTQLMSITRSFKQIESQNNDFRTKLDSILSENKRLELELSHMNEIKCHTKNVEESLVSIMKENERLKLENQQVKDLMREKDTLLEDQRKKISESEDTLIQLISLTNMPKQIESQKEDLGSNLNALEHKNKKLEMDLNNLNEIKLKNIIVEESLKIIENENQRLKVENQELIQNNKNLEKELNNQKQVRNNMAGNESTKLSDENGQVLRYKQKRIDAKNFKEFYDCRIVADSFCSLLDSKLWAIEYNNHEKYKLLKTQNTTKVAVLGYENSGKSFLLSKLTGSELPQGTLMKTTGICLKYPSEKYLPWTALDTPGTNISIKTEQMRTDMAKYFEEKNLSDDDRMRMLLGDNILMENLLQEFVVKHAQVLLVVVGKLHRDDQRLINRIKKLPGKRIIIVHNLMDAQNKEDVEKIIQEDICQTFSVTEKPVYLEKIETRTGEGMNTKVYLENDVQRDKAVEHIVMAHEGSPAGDYFNESAVYYIKTTITSMPFAKPFDLVDAFLKHLNENLRNYLHSKNTAIGDPFILEKDKDGAPKALKLNDHSQYDLKLSSADEFGLIRTFVREGLDHVPYTVKIVHDKSDTRIPKTLRFEFEIVGEYKDQNIKYKVHQCPNNQVRLEIRGKSEDNTIRAVDSIIENTRKFGEFTVVTELFNLEGYVTNPLEKCKRIASEVPGLMILEWNLYPPAE